MTEFPPNVRRAVAFILTEGFIQGLKTSKKMTKKTIATYFSPGMEQELDAYGDEVCEAFLDSDLAVDGTLRDICKVEGIEVISTKEEN